ncbi:MAG TPA: hemolysin family protein [Candidatus Elarobacter sp.]|jgi:CBS domain containing-hemolysin-like protein|nr:hemolysin family protein [Candidatus Elarobacter sp.]
MTAEAHWPEIVAVVLLVGAAAFFAASEAAIVSINRIRTRALVEKNIRGSGRLMRLLENRNRTLTSVLIGSTFVLLAADSVATALFIHWNVPNAAVWSTVVMTVVLLLFGEILPKTIAVGSGERTALRLAPFLEIVTRILSPLTAAFLWITDGLVRIFGGNPHVGPYVTEEDIKTLVNVGVEQNVLEEQERELIHSIIEFGDTIVREVMTPRTDMVTVSVTSSPRRALDLVIAEGYSKLPVYEETVDEIIGVVHDRELLIALSNGTIAQTSLRSLMRPAKLVPENKRISELLREMQREKFSLAIVLDEYGGTAGLVTMEDLLEEIVGEIRDEHDEGEEEPIRRVSEDEAIVDAGTNIEDVNNALGIALPHEEFETIGGYVVGLFGRLPREGEEIEANEGVRLRVDRTRGRRILAVRVLTHGHVPPRNPEEETASVRD